MDKKKIKVLFVCLGNICRSPMAEGIFKKLIAEQGLEDMFFCDSAGTSGFHAGDDPDERMCRTASGYSITLDHKARKFIKADFERFDHILAMDFTNKQNILALAEENELYKRKVRLMRDYDPDGKGRDVPDPYYGGIKGFDEVYHILQISCENLIKQLISNG